MGDIAEMMLDGTLCEGCGVYLHGPSQGVPRRCRDCRPSKAEQAAINVERNKAEHAAAKKHPCPTCGKRLRLVGMADHIRDAHGGVATTPPVPVTQTSMLAGWVLTATRLPEAYRDVPIARADGSERVGRLNQPGCWELASYQVCRDQYMASDVVAWFDTPAYVAEGGAA